MSEKPFHSVFCIVGSYCNKCFLKNAIANSNIIAFSLWRIQINCLVQHKCLLYSALKNCITCDLVHSKAVAALKKSTVARSI